VFDDAGDAPGFGLEQLPPGGRVGEDGEAGAVWSMRRSMLARRVPPMPRASCRMAASG